MQISINKEELLNICNLLEPIASEVLVRIREHKVLITAVDPAHVMMIKVKYILDNYNTDDQDFDFNINVDLVKCFLSHTDLNEPVDIGILEDGRIELHDRGCRFTMAKVENVSALKFPRFDHNVMADVNIEDILKLISRCSYMSNSIVFMLNEKTLRIGTIGEKGLAEIYQDFQITGKYPKTTSSYSIEYLYSIIKVLKNAYTGSVVISFSSDYPASFLAGFGNQVEYIISPKLGKEEDEEIDVLKVAKKRWFPESNIQTER